jgi:hypothetical protein
MEAKLSKEQRTLLIIPLVILVYVFFIPASILFWIAFGITKIGSYLTYRLEAWTVKE